MRRSAANRGFTLIEISIALAIGAMLMTVAIAGVNSITDANLRSAAITLTGAIKGNYDRAIMNKRTQRLAMDIDKGLWWIEYTDDPYALAAKLEKGDGSKDEDDDKDEDPFADEDMDAEVKNALEGGRAASFRPDGELGEPQRLPGEVRFSRILTGHQEEAFTAGVAYLHFFRAGWTEPARIEITDGTEYTTLEVQPLIGRVRTYHERMDEDWKNEEIDKSEENETW